MAIHLSKKAKIVIGVGVLVNVGVVIAYIAYKKREAAKYLQSITLTPVQPDTVVVN